MDESDRERWKERETKEIAKFEQKLPEFRSTFEQLNKEERICFREWLEQLDAIAGSVEDHHWKMEVIIRTHIPSHTEDGEPIFEGEAVELTPHVIHKAVLAWEKGEQFSPGGIFGTF